MSLYSQPAWSEPLGHSTSIVKIDGRLDSAEWEGAQRITDFRPTQPLSRGPALQPTEALVLATPEGLAIGFRNQQSTDIPRTRQRAQRDKGAPADQVNLYVDFDGEGRTGYNFTLLLTSDRSSPRTRVSSTYRSVRSVATVA